MKSMQKKPKKQKGNPLKDEPMTSVCVVAILPDGLDVSYFLLLHSMFIDYRP